MGSAPKAPDPQKMAAQQTASNINTATAQQWLNNTNQITPYGNLTYNQIGTHNVGGQKVPQFSATQTLAPEEMAALQRERGLNQLWDETALRQGKVASDVMAQPFHYTTGEHEKWAGDLYNKLSAPTNEANRAAMAQRLAGQGLQPGSAAYNDAMQNLLFAQDKARNDFGLGAYGEGFQQALTERNQPLNEVAAMMGMGGINQPQWTSTPQAQVPGTDIAGLMANNYNQQMGQYNAQMGALAGLGGAALGGWASGGFANPFKMFG